MKDRAIHILSGLSETKIIYLGGERAHIWMVMAAQSRQTVNRLKNYAEKLSQIQLSEKPEDPITGEGTARLITDMAARRRRTHICNVPNRGAVTNPPAEAVLEPLGQEHGHLGVLERARDGE